DSNCRVLRSRCFCSYLPTFFLIRAIGAPLVTAPLGMGDTTTKLSEVQTPRAMIGVDLDGKEAPLLGNACGDGCFGQRLHHRGRHDKVDALAPCGQRCRRRRGAHDRPCPLPMARWPQGSVGVGGKIMDGLGLGWIISLPKGKRPLILAKSGGIAGFITYS